MQCFDYATNNPAVKNSAAQKTPNTVFAAQEAIAKGDRAAFRVSDKSVIIAQM